MTAVAQAAERDADRDGSHETLVPLTIAAHQLGWSREKTMRAVLRHRLVGRFIEGFWYVERAALEGILREPLSAGSSDVAPQHA